jgi:hypothetical protein
MAFGAVYIQQRLGVTDRETVALITESPYLQFFIGLSGYQPLPPFDPSMMVHFRKRIGPELMKVCNNITKASGIAMIQELLAESQQEDGTDQEQQKQLAAIEEELGVKPASLEADSNWGTLVLDATCVPDDIPYPVDLRLLDDSRETTEKMIDELFKGSCRERSAVSPAAIAIKLRIYFWLSSRRRSQSVRRSAMRSASSSTRTAVT